MLYYWMPQDAMGCILIAGCIMLLLTITNLVTRSMKYVPGHIKLATIIGIGLLLATIGFESAGVIDNGQAHIYIYSFPSCGHALLAADMLSSTASYQRP